MLDVYLIGCIKRHSIASVAITKRHITVSVAVLNNTFQLYVIRSVYTLNGDGIFIRHRVSKADSSRRNC